MTTPFARRTVAMLAFAACTTVGGLTLASAANAAIQPKDTYVNGTWVAGYLGKTTDQNYWDTMKEPSWEEQWTDAWKACEWLLKTDANQLRSVKLVNKHISKVGDGYVQIGFACSATPQP